MRNRHGETSENILHGHRCVAFHFNLALFSVFLGAFVRLCPRDQNWSHPIGQRAQRLIALARAHTTNHLYTSSSKFAISKLLLSQRSPSFAPSPHLRPSEYRYLDYSFSDHTVLGDLPCTAFAARHHSQASYKQCCEL